MHNEYIKIIIGEYSIDRTFIKDSQTSNGKVVQKMKKTRLRKIKPYEGQLTKNVKNGHENVSIGFPLTVLVTVLKKDIKEDPENSECKFRY